MEEFHLAVGSDIFFLENISTAHRDGQYNPPCVDGDRHSLQEASWQSHVNIIESKHEDRATTARWLPTAAAPSGLTPYVGGKEPRVD